MKHTHYSVQENEDIVMAILEALSEGKTVRHGVENYAAQSGTTRNVSSIIHHWQCELRQNYLDADKLARQEGRQKRITNNIKTNRQRQVEKTFNQLNKPEITKSDLISYIRGVTIVDRNIRKEYEKDKETIESLEAQVNALKKENKALRETNISLSKQNESMTEELTVLLKGFNFARKYLDGVPKGSSAKITSDGFGHIQTVEIEDEQESVSAGA